MLKTEKVFEQNETFYQNTIDFYNWEYDKRFINGNIKCPHISLPLMQVFI